MLPIQSERSMAWTNSWISTGPCQPNWKISRPSKSKPRRRQFQLDLSSPRELEARNKLIEDHLSLAHAIAGQVARTLPSWWTQDDLIGPAELALVKVASSRALLGQRSVTEFV